MRFIDLRARLKINIFTLLDIEKYFSDENPQAIKIQLSRFVKKGLLAKLKRGIYCFDTKSLDELVIANRLYSPSYISLESALNYYGIIPDIPQMVTSISLTTSKKISNLIGNFTYYKIKHQLFFGFTKVKSTKITEYFLIAEPEKAFLDYLYIRKHRNLSDLRLNISSLDRSKLNLYRSHFPQWIPEAKL